jgi:hypothetical protein
MIVCEEVGFAVVEATATDLLSAANFWPVGSVKTSKTINSGLAIGTSILG